MKKVMFVLLASAMLMPIVIGIVVQILFLGFVVGWGYSKDVSLNLAETWKYRR